MQVQEHAPYCFIVSPLSHTTINIPCETYMALGTVCTRLYPSIGFSESVSGDHGWDLFMFSVCTNYDPDKTSCGWNTSRIK